MTSWNYAKSLIQQYNLNIKFTENEYFYYIKIYNELSFVDECSINKLLELEYKEDFEINYKSIANTKTVQAIEIAKDKPFKDPLNYLARFQGFEGTAIKNTVTNLDFLISEDRYINGAGLILKNQVFGDKVDFCVIDKDNILGLGADVILNTFGKDWYVAEDKQHSPDVIIEYPAKILAGLYIRIKYTSTGTQNDVLVKLNLRLHKVIEE